MSCTFTEKLAPEIRVKIYEYALSFDTPLRHADRFQPFLKRFTGIEGTLPFAMDTPLPQRLETDGVIRPYDGESLQPLSGPFHTAAPETKDQWMKRKDQLRGVNTSILVANKLIYSEAVCVFYSLNTISMEAALLKATNAPSAGTACDLSLTHALLAKPDFNNSVPGLGEYSINLEVFCRHVQELLPKLRHVTINLDGAYSPRDLLFQIVRCHRHAKTIKNLRFNGVGSLIAQNTDGGLDILVKFQNMIDLWELCLKDHLTSAVKRRAGFGGAMDDGRHCGIAAFLWRCLQPNQNTVTTCIRRVIDRIFLPSFHAWMTGFETSGMDSYEFWAYMAGLDLGIQSASEKLAVREI